jgi:Fe-S cluster biogenesis protein NfuA
LRRGGKSGMMDPGERRWIVREKVEEALNSIRPGLQADGGDVELVEVTDEGVVKVRLKGACGGCPMSQLTLKQGIERRLKASIPEVKSVESVPPQR